MRVSGDTSFSGAPQVAQNLAPAVTGDPHRAHAGPEPGAVRRRPQLEQKGSSPVTVEPQNGHADASARVVGSGAAPAVMATCVGGSGARDGWGRGVGGVTPAGPTPPPPPATPPLADFTAAAALPSGLPQAMMT